MVAGDYEIGNLRIERNGLPVLDVAPSRIPLKVIDQILVTSVKTRPLTLDEIRARGSTSRSPDNYLGFSFAIALKLESKVVTIDMPVVFDRQGNVVPDRSNRRPPRPGRVPRAPAHDRPRADAAGRGGVRAAARSPKLELPGSGGGFSIPALLVIPGDVGYLKQFFTAQLFVANGAPVGSGLVVAGRHGNDPAAPREGRRAGPQPRRLHRRERARDLSERRPAVPPDLVRDDQSVPHPETLPVAQVGPDGTPGTEDDDGALRPAEQGMADFTIRGRAGGLPPDRLRPSRRAAGAARSVRADQGQGERGRPRPEREVQALLRGALGRAADEEFTLTWWSRTSARARRRTS